MSKERELLKKVIQDDPDDGVMSLYLHKEVMDYLAQPEQEPVAWRYKTHNRYTYAETNYHEIEGEPLYTSPPKREPLSDEILYPIAEERINDEGIAGFYDGFRYAEKHYKIGE